MGYEIASPATGKRLQMLHREWELLLELAERYGWEPAWERRDYAKGGRIAEGDARSMAAALARALPDVPGFYADGLAEEERTRPTILPELRARPGDEQADPLAYFSGRRRNTLRNFVNWMGTGPFEVRPLPAPSTEV